MPRIAAAFASLGLIVLSIGVNIWRYPVVGEMVVGPSESSQSDEPPQLASADQAAETGQSGEWGPSRGHSTEETLGSSSETGTTFCNGYTCSIGAGTSDPVDAGAEEDHWAVEQTDDDSTYGASTYEPSSYEYGTPSADLSAHYEWEDEEGLHGRVSSTPPNYEREEEEGAQGREAQAVPEGVHRSRGGGSAGHTPDNPGHHAVHHQLRGGLPGRGRRRGANG